MFIRHIEIMKDLIKELNDIKHDFKLIETSVERKILINSFRKTLEKYLNLGEFKKEKEN